MTRGTDRCIMVFNLRRESKKLDKSMKLKKRTEALSDGTGAPSDGTSKMPVEMQEHTGQMWKVHWRNAGKHLRTANANADWTPKLLPSSAIDQRFMDRHQ
ncbi:hypothetical protein HAX54_039427 [Datura stramonium]|uniref:Uncharacterized protein n=1 Tax=Datura stramonium TaxID=4076 RepID=A0ABS8SJ73_DATST|nr:hypothetical protein [Datura stramonium]